MDSWFFGIWDFFGFSDLDQAFLFGFLGLHWFFRIWIRFFGCWFLFGFSGFGIWVLGFSGLGSWFGFSGFGFVSFADTKM